MLKLNVLLILTFWDFTTSAVIKTTPLVKTKSPKSTSLGKTMNTAYG